MTGSRTERDATATEAERKRFSFAALHATHGVLAGNGRGYSEPGLILTPPPDDATTAMLEEDDGFLSTSEIARLKLDADWVILSACNTAAGSAQSTEALSGLARAFLYAGARALLVSNWEVYTNAAVDLTTRTMQAMAASDKLGRAAAIRSAIEGMMHDAANDNDAFRLHPSYWGAFSIVGVDGR